MSHLNLNDPTGKLTQVRIAGIRLFGPQQALHADFTDKLSLEAIKSAFREKARRYHPDLQTHAAPEMAAQNRHRFIQVKESYELLKDFVAGHQPQPETAAIRQKKIIAVGGAKGGIGKSTFATNLAVYLAAQGRRTVMVDLDLGGANLHLYLGQTYVRNCVNDYFAREVANLEDLLIPTQYGPLLIGGDSSQLGAANISFWSKLKLIKSLREMDADYVIIDLGSNTSFNILDFFLAADSRLVVTTCEPASYLEAYNFIKVGLLRRLNRLFGGESPDAGKRNHALQDLIHEATMSAHGAKAKDIPALLQRVQERHADYLPTLQKAIDTYQPFLVVNKVDDIGEVEPIVRRIQDVSRRMLGIRVRYLGTLPYLDEVKKSTLELVPEVARNSRGPLAQRMAAISKDL
ncbi:MAG: nucleotide-binding protein [Desulfobaccales bacterium]